MGERVIPPACVAALRDYSPREAGCPHWLALKPWQRDEGAHDDPVMCDWCAPAIARAVLDAFVAGEGKGPVRLVGNPEEGYALRRKGHPGVEWAMAGIETQGQANAVAAVLNYLEAKGE